MTLKKVVIFLTLILWPLGLYLFNRPTDFFSYTIPALFLITGYLLYTKGKQYLWFVPIWSIPFFAPKLSLLPLILALGIFIWKKERLKASVLIFFSLLAILLNWKDFRGQTIFTPDYEARQEVIRNTQLYPSIFLARLFHNKARIYLDKFDANFFALVDPNNYFFGFHPREIPFDNQNLDKFPFLAIPFLLYGFLRLGKRRNWEFILAVLTASLVSLSILSSFDRNDFVLWVPLSLIIVHGTAEFGAALKKKANYYYLLFIFLAVIQIARLLILKL